MRRSSVRHQALMNMEKKFPLMLQMARKFITQKSYTYTEALEILKDRMKELGMLNADEQTAPNGAAAVFSYVGNVTINDTELYQIRVDLKSGTQTTTEGNYGVGIKNGKCYQITGTEGAYQASSY